VRRLLPDPSGDLGPDDLDAAYAPPVPPPGSVHVRANMVSSADGAAVLDGHSEGLSGPADKSVFRVLRGLADVVLVGAGTVRSESYGPVRPTAERREKRAASGYAPIPPIAVVSRRLDLDLSSRFFAEAVARPLVVTCGAAPESARAAASAVADVVVAGEETVDLGEALTALAERGLSRLLCEGGPALLADLVAADLLDELCLTLSPLLAGGADATRATAGAASPPRGMALAHVLEQDGALFLRYARAG
jgi:riboflavin biosynthesis pyrimidine reductase